MAMPLPSTATDWRRHCVCMLLAQDRDGAAGAAPGRAFELFQAQHQINQDEHARSQDWRSSAGRSMPDKPGPWLPLASLYSTRQGSKNKNNKEEIRTTAKEKGKNKSKKGIKYFIHDMINRKIKTHQSQG